MVIRIKVVDQNACRIPIARLIELAPTINAWTLALESVDKMLSALWLTIFPLVVALRITREIHLPSADLLEVSAELINSKENFEESY